MAERRIPDEIVIRQLVERALEAVEAGQGATEDRTSAAPTPAVEPAGQAVAPARTVAIGADHGGFALKGVPSRGTSRPRASV